MTPTSLCQDRMATATHGLTWSRAINSEAVVPQ